MGERIIHPKFNVHENYKRVNIINPYRFGGGAVAHEPETVALMASIGWADDATPSPHNGLTYAQVYTKLDTYFAACKAGGFLSKLKAVYLFIGNNASTHKWNAVNPQDTDAAHRILWNGGGVHSATGWKGNGTNSYGDTRFNQLNGSILNNESIGIYRNQLTLENKRDFGAYTNIGSLIVSQSTSDSTGFYSQSASQVLLAGNGLGFYTSSRKNSTNLTIQNNSSFSTRNLSSSSLIDLSYFIGCLNLSGSPFGNSNTGFSYAFIGEGLTEAQMTAHYNAVQQLQTDLGRQV